MASKNKFDLTKLVQSGHLNDGECIYFVSNPTLTAQITKQANGDYKINAAGNAVSIHACAQTWLGTEPPNHASQWLRTESGKTLFEIWQSTMDAE